MFNRSGPHNKSRLIRTSDARQSLPSWLEERYSKHDGNIVKAKNETTSQNQIHPNRRISWEMEHMRMDARDIVDLTCIILTSARLENKEKNIWAWTIFRSDFLYPEGLLLLLLLLYSIVSATPRIHRSW